MSVSSRPSRVIRQHWTLWAQVAEVHEGSQDCGAWLGDKQ